MYFLRAGPQLGVAKAARAPPCTLPILGRRFILDLLNKNYYVPSTLSISSAVVIPWWMRWVAFSCMVPSA